MVEGKIKKRITGNVVSGFLAKNIQICEDFDLPVISTVSLYTSRVFSGVLEGFSKSSCIYTNLYFLMTKRWFE